MPITSEELAHLTTVRLSYKGFARHMITGSSRAPRYSPIGAIARYRLQAKGGMTAAAIDEKLRRYPEGNGRVVNACRVAALDLAELIIGTGIDNWIKLLAMSPDALRSRLKRRIASVVRGRRTCC